MLKRLTAQEAKIMQILWKVGEDITQQELIDRMEMRTGERLHRNTISSFIKILTNKQYIVTYHKGTIKYIHIVHTLEDEIKDQVNWLADYYYSGDKSAIKSLMEEI